MPFRVRTIDEIVSDVNQKLGIGGGGQPFRDPALEPGFRVKTGDELSGYTRETPGQESARLAGEYNRAGSNNPQAYGYSSFSPLRYVQQGFGGLAQGVGEGLVATVGGVTDTLARISDNTIGTDFGSPVNSALMQSERLMQEMGEGNTSWFLRNVAKSATKLLAAAPAGAGGVAANIFLEPAHQSYIRAREAGMSPKVALGYGVAHGATEAAANAFIERFVPGASSMALKFVSSAVADDVAKVVLPGVIGALAKSGQVAGSEGLEEGAAFMLGAAIDESFRVATGIAAGKQYSDPMDFAKDLGKSVAMGFAAGGLIGGGLQSMQWVNTQAAINRLAEQGQQPKQEPLDGSQQPTPLADPTLPVQPTSPSQPAAIDPGQGAEPPVTPEVVQPPSKEQWAASIMDVKQSEEFLSNLRAGDERSKNKGSKSPEVVRSPQTTTRIPLSAIPPDVVQFLRETTDPERVASYRGQKIDAPVLLFPRKKGGGWGVSDGGHRVIAAIDRGDKYINAVVPADSYDAVVKEFQQPNALPELPRTERDQPDPSTLFDREMASLDTKNPEMSYTRSEIASKPADVIAKIAALEKPSRGAFAQALGVKPGNLPNTLDSQSKREYAVKVARKIQDVEKVNAARREMDNVVNAMRQVNPQASSGALVPIRDLRQQFPEVPKEQFDANLWRMIRAKKLAPDRIDNARQLSPQQLDEMLTDGDGNYYIGVKIPGTSGVNPGPMADAPLESRGAPASVLNQATGSSSKGAQGAVGTPTNQNFGPSKTDRRTTIRDVTDSMLSAAEMIVGGRVPVGESSFPKNPGQKGQFHPRDRDVRVDTRNNLPTTAHELGHAMHTSGSKALNPPMGTKARMDLWRLGKKQGYAPMVEGPAEFIRLYVQEGPAGAQREAPHLYDHFVKTMQAENPAALKKLDEAADRYTILTREMGPVDRLKSQIVDPTDKSRDRSKVLTRKYWEDSWNWFVGNFVDSAEVVGRMKAESKRWSKAVMGKEISIPKRLDPANWLVMLHGLAAARTKSAVEGSPIKWDGQESGEKGLRDILSPLGGKGEAVDDFNAYLYARRSLASQDPQHLARMNAARKAAFGPDTPDIPPMRTGVTLKDVRQSILELEAKYNGQNGTPDFRAMSLEYYQFWDGVLTYMADASPTLRQQVTTIRAGDPGFYTPLMRDIEATDPPAPVRSAASGQIGRRREGSDRAVLDPLAQAVKVLEARYTTAHQRVFLESIVALGNVAKTPAYGMGQFIKKLDPGMSPSDGKASFQVYEKGKMETYQVNDEGVLRVLQSLDPVSFAGLGFIGVMIDKLLVNPSSTLKKFATVYNPRFGLITQTVFAFPEMLAVGASFADPYKAKQASNALQATWRRGQNYASMTKNFFLNSAHIFLDAVSGGKAPPLLRDVANAIEGFKRDGLKFETSIRNDDTAAYELSRWAAGKGVVQIAKEDGAGGLIRWFLNAVPNYAQNVIGSVQEGAALATYQATLQRLGLSVNDPKTVAQRMEIAEAVKEGTGNYSRRGIAARKLEKIMPYSTAGLVHGASLVRAIQNDPANVATVWGLGLLASIAAVVLAMEDEEYREADVSQKVKYAHLKTKDGWILLPAYSEFGLSTHGLAVSLVHGLYGDKDAFAQLGEAVKTLSLSYVPASWNPAIAEVASQAMNRDVRTGQPLVPNYRDKRPGDKQPTVISERKPAEQYTDKTTIGAKLLGAATGVSPMRIEHAADTLTGRQFSNLQNMAFGKKTVAQGIGPISREAGNLSAKDEATDRLYESIRKANEIKSDPAGGENAQQRESRLMLEAADAARDAWSALQRATKDPAKVKEYAAKKREVSRVAVEQYDKGDSSKSAFAVQERVAKVLLAKEWDQPEEVAKLVANGVDDLTRSVPLVATKGKTMAETRAKFNEDQDRAREFAKASGLPTDEIVKLAEQYMGDDLSPGLKRQKLQRLRANLARK